MAADLSYIHVTMPSNISTLYQQADVFKNYLTDLANFTTSKMHRIPFTKAVRDAGQIGLQSLRRNCHQPERHRLQPSSLPTQWKKKKGHLEKLY